MISSLLEKNSNFIFDKNILREYDIRGIVGTSINEDIAFLLGKAFASKVLQLVDSKIVIVGRDLRDSSLFLSKFFIAGILSTGLDVFDFGVCPTPLLYFSSFLLKPTASVMVTGSHNPLNHNGFKLNILNKPFFGESIKELGYMIEKSTYLEGCGRIINYDYDFKKTYILELLDSCLENKLKVVWDVAGSAVAEIIKELCAKLPGEHILINYELKIRDPNFSPDPSIEENLKTIKEIIKTEKCDIGIAFDGDGDRVTILDDKGRTLSGEQIYSVFAADILSRNFSNNLMIVDIKTSQSLIDDLKASGAKVIISKTGHSFIKNTMFEKGAIFAGEMSGHFYFADKYYAFDDGIYAAIRMIELVSKIGFKLSEIIDSMPARNISKEIKIDCDDNKKFQIINEIQLRLKKSGIKFNDIDGVRLTNKYGWWLIRASNTSSYLIVKWESYDNENLGKLKKEILEQLNKSGILVDL